MSGAPLYLQAAFWGFVGGSALILGAVIAYLVRLPQRVVAAVMAFGSGVLISALSFDLMDEALQRGGFLATGAGFVAGAAVYTGANMLLARAGARHRKRSGDQQAQSAVAHGEANSGSAIALGALLDGVPESVVIGVSLLPGASGQAGKVSLVALAAVFLSNIPEGLSSVAGMRKAGRSPRYVFGVWGGIALASGVAAGLGALLLGGASGATIAFINAVAAGAILAMLADTMIPEAFETAHDYAGLITVLGFLTAFGLSKTMG